MNLLLNPFDESQNEWRWSVCKTEPVAISNTLTGMWDAIFDTREAGVGVFKARLAKIKSAVSYSSMRRAAPPAIPANWPRGMCAEEPGIEAGICATMLAGISTEVVLITPRSPHFVQHDLEIKQVRVQPNGVVAHIDTEIDGAMLTFYDSHFIDNRALYYPDAQYSFLLSAIAVACRPHVQVSMPLNFTDAQRKHWHEIYAKSGLGDIEPPETISSAGASVFITDSKKPGFCQFQTPIIAVEDIVFMDNPAWVLTIPLLRRLDDATYNFKLVVTSRVWKNELPPTVGMDIEGVLWLEGRLWNTRWTQST